MYLHEKLYIRFNSFFSLSENTGINISLSGVNESKLHPHNNFSYILHKSLDLQSIHIGEYNVLDISEAKFHISNIFSKFKRSKSSETFKIQFSLQICIFLIFPYSFTCSKFANIFILPLSDKTLSPELCSYHKQYFITFLYSIE